MSSKMNRSISIQALRGLAFLSIFAYHAGLVPSGGGFGVSIFFVLSGFLLMYRSDGKEMVNVPFSNLKYSLTKIRKLYPLHIVMSMVALPLLLRRYLGQAHAAFNISFRIAVNVLLIQSWFPWESIRYSLNNLSWFLSCMLFLYFMFPVIHNKLTNYVSIRKITVWGIFAWIIMWILGYLANLYCVRNGIAPSFCQGLTYNNPIYRLGDFFIGCTAGAIYKRTNSDLSKKRLRFLKRLF